MESDNKIDLPGKESDNITDKTNLDSDNDHKANLDSDKSSTGKSKKSVKQSEILQSMPNSNPEKLSSTILKQNHWLNDEHIDHAQWLLTQTFPHSNGLYSVLAFQGRKPKVERGLEDFVQIINVGGNHWVSITNIGCKENAIKVYDSLFLELCEKEQEKFFVFSRIA
jgi:hypothetical protein